MDAADAKSPNEAEASRWVAGRRLALRRGAPLTTETEPARETTAEEVGAKAPRAHNRLRIAIIALILLWTFCYNLLIKRQPPSRAFFRILDTISDDFVMGAALTIGVGVGIVAVFSATKLYTQVIANVRSFRLLEELVHGELLRGHVRGFFTRLLNFQDQPQPPTACPTRVSSLALSFCFIYVMSWVYVVLFSEALFFVSWSAGVDLPIDNPNNLLMLPTLALAIPFSARVMAYLRYPYAQDYADFMPGAVFVLLLVGSLGLLFGSDDQQFFLLRVWRDLDYRIEFMRNGAYLAFIPVFFEGAFWLLELGRDEDRAA
jgi:hypothetical protein